MSSPQNDLWASDQDSLNLRDRHRGSPERLSSSRESTPSFVTASGDFPTAEARAIEGSLRDGIPDSVNGWHPHVAEPPILHRGASRFRALLRSTLQAICLTRPSQDRTSSPPKVSHERRARFPGKGFCVLSLDGGGCRGYISLLILKHILRQLQPEGPIYPYLYFDLICGTSTGGLITILLAVLHLDIDTAINIYKVLIEEVFTGGFSVIRYLLKDAGYSRKPLKRAIDKILHQYAKQRDGEKVTQMEDPLHNRGCRGIATTTHCVGEGRTVIALRSYTYPEGAKIPHLHNWTWVDAALATAAAPMFFKRHSITKDKHRFFFEDAGAHRMNNPTKFALEECQRLDAADSQLNAMANSLFISLGTGTRGNASAPEEPGWFGLFQTKMATLRASTRYATDVNDVHESMKARVGDSKMAYFRLNPPLGHKISLGDWEEVPAMEESVAQYCEQNTTEIQQVVDHLRSFQTAERRGHQD